MPGARCSEQAEGWMNGTGMESAVNIKGVRLTVLPLRFAVYESAEVRTVFI